MKAFLINPTTQTITEVEQYGLHSLYQLISCQTVTAIPVESGSSDTVYVDDNALSITPQPPVFEINGIKIAGNGVVVGIDEDGDDTEPNISLEGLQRKVTFLGDVEIDDEIEVFAWS